MSVRTAHRAGRRGRTRTPNLAWLLALFLFGLGSCEDGGASGVAEEAARSSEGAVHTSEADTSTSEADAPTAEAIEPPPRGSLESDRDSHDFGDLFAGSLRTTSFELTAAGAEPLIVTDVGHSCGCTKGELFVLDDAGAEHPVEMGRPYAAGTRLRLHASLNTQGRGGEQEQRVVIELAGNPDLQTFTLHALVVPFLDCVPHRPRISEASVLEGFVFELVVSSRSGEPFGVDVLREYLPEGMDVRFEAIDPGEDGRASAWTMILSAAPGLPRGEFRRKLILVTDERNTEAEPLPDGSAPFHMGEIWIRADVAGVFQLSPEALNFADLYPGRAATKKVVIRSRDPLFELTDVQVALLDKDGSGPHPHSSAFDIQARAIESGRAWQLDIELQEYPVAGNFSGILMVEVGHPVEPEFQIPFKGRAVRPRD